jgi:hypothetical protein
MSTKTQNEIASVINEGMNKLKPINEKIHKLIIQREEEGFFESHQTTGSIKQLAQEIIGIVLGKEQNES